MSSGGSIGLAIVIMGALVGLAISQPHLNGAMDDLRQAREGLKNSAISIKNIDISLGGAYHNNTTRELGIGISNTGSEPIERADIQFLLDGILIHPAARGDPFIYPGGSLYFSFENVTKPLSVMVVGPFGIARHMNGSMIEDV